MKVVRGATTDRLVSKTIEFTGASGLGQSAVDVDIFTVTGEVLFLYTVPYCTENMVSAGGGTIELAVKASGTVLAATTATDLAVGEFWLDTSPSLADIIIPDGLVDLAVAANIIVVVGINNVTDGTIRFDVIWRPLSSDGLVTPA